MQGKTPRAMLGKLPRVGANQSTLRATRGASFAGGWNDKLFARFRQNRTQNMFLHLTLRWVIEPRLPRYAILVGFLALTLWGLSRGLFRDLPRISSFNKPPMQSDSYLAETVLFHYFPFEVMAEQYATHVIIQRRGGNSNNVATSIVLDPQIVEFERSLELLLRYEFPTDRDMYYSSYRTNKRQGFDYLANQLVQGNDTQLVQISLFKPPTYIDNFADFVDDAVNLLAKVHLRDSHYFVASTGPQVFNRDLKQASESDVLVIHASTLPLALLVLAATFRSFRLLILPILMFVAVMSISTLLLSFTGMGITSLVPSIMSASSIGQSVDASLFLLSRFREELKRGSIVQQSVHQSFVYAGHTIVVSGCTLAFCWFVLVLFPVDLVKTVGVAVGINTLVSLVVNLLLTPALLLTFPLFFSSTVSFFSLASCRTKREQTGRRMMRFCRLCCACCCRCQACQHYHPNFRTSSMRSIIVSAYSDDEDGEECRNGNVRTALLSPRDDENDIIEEGDYIHVPLATASDNLPLPLAEIDNEVQVNAELRYLEASAKRTFRVARFVTRSKTTAFIIVLVLSIFLIVPFAALAFQFSHSNSVRLMVPRGFPGTMALERMQHEFGAGRLSPYQLVIVHQHGGIPKAAHAERAAYFDFIHERILLPLKDSVVSIESAVYMFDQPISYAQLSSCALRPASIRSNKCKTLLHVAMRTINSLDTLEAISVKIELPFDPNSERGHSWLKSTRKQMETLPLVDVHVAAGAAVALDVIQTVYNSFPLCVAFTCAVILVFIAIAFKSLVVPLRALFSIFTTLCVVYGSAVLVYEYGMLEFTQVPGLQSETGEIIWVAPIMLFGVLCGISLDYDTFSLTRIVEYKTAGFSDTDSVRAGLASSFKVVSTAGLIMTISFAGLLFSSVPVLNQVSYFLVTAVLFDTFVVRILFVPSLMILLGRFNWFPRSGVAKWETQS